MVIMLKATFLILYTWHQVCGGVDVAVSNSPLIIDAKKNISEQAYWENEHNQMFSTGSDVYTEWKRISYIVEELGKDPLLLYCQQFLKSIQVDEKVSNAEFPQNLTLGYRHLTNQIRNQQVSAVVCSTLDINASPKTYMLIKSPYYNCVYLLDDKPSVSDDDKFPEPIPYFILLRSCDFEDDNGIYHYKPDGNSSSSRGPKKGNWKK